MKLSMARWMTNFSVVALALVTPACAMDQGDSSEEIEGAAEGEEGPIATSEDAITGSVAVGTTLQTTTALNLRTGPGTSYAIILGLPYGARVSVVRSSPSNGFYNVKYGTRTGWAHGSWLKLAGSSSSGGSVSISGPAVLWHVQNFANKACAAYGCPYAVGTYVGHQPTASRAIDMMMARHGTYPSSTNQTRGSNIAGYAVRNAGTHKVLYAIWRQRINTLDGRGWVWMADRGSITQNHYDHVHVSFKS